MWVSMHDTNDSWVALLWLIPFVKACFEKYNQCFSGGWWSFLHCWSITKWMLARPLSKWADMTCLLDYLWKIQDYHLTEQILCVVLPVTRLDRSENHRWWIQIHYLYHMFNACHVCLTLWCAMHLHSNTVPGQIFLQWPAVCYRVEQYSNLYFNGNK